MRIVDCFIHKDGRPHGIADECENRLILANLLTGDLSFLDKEGSDVLERHKIAFFKHRVVDGGLHFFNTGSIVWAPAYGAKTMAFDDDGLWQYVHREDIEPLEDTVKVTGDGDRVPHLFSVGDYAQVAREQKFPLTTMLVRNDGLQQALLAEDFVGVQND